MSDIVDKPGIYDMAEDVYHGDKGSLSVSGAKLLLPPNCPAIFEHQRRHPKPPTAAMEFGTVAHTLILGKGQDIEIIDAPDYRKNDVRRQRDAAIEAGRVPILIGDYRRAEAIEAAVRDDDDAGPLFDAGDPEQSMFWIDQEFGIWLRGRMDWLTYFNGRPVITDVKTCGDASPDEFARSIARYRYDMQDVHYRQGLGAILGCDWQEIDFVFVAVPTSEPYLVMTYRLEDERDIANGLESCRIAREKFRDCTAAGVWPKWSSGITPLTLPPYARRQIESGINDYYN